MNRPPHPRALASLLGVVLGLAVACGSYAYGSRVHTCMVPGGEYDHYVLMAERLLAGEVPQDPFHPLTYPLLVAGVTLPLGDAFAAGRLVSAAALGFLVFSMQRLARDAFGATVAAILAVPIALHPIVFVQSLQADSDMLGIALVIGAYAMTLAARRDATPWRFVAGGLLAGAAWATRYNLVIHLPVLALVALSSKSWLRSLSALGLGAAVGYLPHGILNCLTVGSPFTNSSWRSIPLKYAFDYDGTTILAAGGGTEGWRLLRENWLQWTWRGLTDFTRWLHSGLPSDILGPDLALSAVGAWLPVAAFAAAAFWAIHRRRGPAVVLLLAAAMHAASIAVTFYPITRIVLPALLLGAYGLALAFIDRPGRAAAIVGAVLAAGAASLSFAMLPGACRSFERQHPLAEIAAARRIVEQNGPATSLAGTYLVVGRYLPPCAIAAWLPSFGLRTDVTAADCVRRMEQLRSELGITEFVIGRMTGDQYYGCLRDRALPSGWLVVEQTDDLLVIHTPHHDEWIQRLQVVPARWSAGALRLELRLHDDVDGTKVMSAAVTAFAPDGQATILQLRPDGPGVFAMTLAAPTLARGEWRIEPVIVLLDNSLRRGPAARLLVE